MPSYFDESQRVFELAVQHVARRSTTEALDCLSRAEAMGANADSCSGERWFCWMLLGEFERAWLESDAIARRNTAVENCFWDGLPFDGKRVMVRSLHGYGDFIQFLRYVPLVRKRAAKIIVETHPDLVSLVRAQPYVDRAITWTDAEANDSREWDQQIEVMEFPRAFRTALETIPREVPYVAVPETMIRTFASMVSAFPRPRVGLVWGASDWDSTRSIPVSCLEPILSVPGISFFSFQHGRHRDALREIPGESAVFDTAPHCRDILQTAAGLRCMDLLITVDTLAAHLAGALGLEVWTLLQRHADWRWMLDRDDSPWYPTMQLFRQTHTGAWAEPIEAAASQLSLKFSP